MSNTHTHTHEQVNASEFFKADKDHAFKLRTSDGADAGAVNLLHHHLIKRYRYAHLRGGLASPMMPRWRGPVLMSVHVLAASSTMCRADVRYR